MIIITICMTVSEPSGFIEATNNKTALRHLHIPPKGKFFSFGKMKPKYSRICAKKNVPKKGRFKIVKKC